MFMDALKKPRGMYNAVIIILCVIMPWLAPAIGQDFFTDVFTRTMIFAIAAISLNLIMGFGGMISFGHAVYIGIGGYTVGIFSFHGIDNGWIQWPTALALCAFFSLIFGAISLRTRGVYFIMITLAFAQMMYFLSISIEKYGSDDGLNIDNQSQFGLSFFDLSDPLTIYYTAFVCMMLCVYITYKLVNSRFGMVMQGSMSNDERMRSIGYPTYGYKLTAFVIAGMMAGLSGILSANFEAFMSPEYLFWTVSGDLIFMVVLGGMGTIFGPIGGTVLFLVIAEILSNITESWHLIFGPLLILVVLYMRGGMEGFFKSLERSPNG